MGKPTGRATVSPEEDTYLGCDRLERERSPAGAGRGRPGGGFSRIFALLFPTVVSLEVAYGNMYDEFGKQESALS